MKVELKRIESKTKCDSNKLLSNCNKFWMKSIK